MIELAGGEDVLGLAGTMSRTVDWDEVRASRPEIVVLMPCGYDAEVTLREAHEHVGELAVLGAEALYAADAAAYFSRPGPRLVDGVELLAHLIHPDRVPTWGGNRALALSA
jgi:iron complex transport system substrate-binding protein